jgi:hypothetical protein
MTTIIFKAIQTARNVAAKAGSHHWHKTQLLIIFSCLLPMSPGYAGKPSTSTGTSSYVPMSMQYENYNFRNLSGDNSCLGEDDAFAWKAVGGLKPGESFTFTPQYPACFAHSAAISVVLSWQGSQLQLSSNAPDNDVRSWDQSQKGRLIIAPTVGNTAQLCMFPAYESSGIVYTITVTNVGAAIADNVVIDGRSDNDWAVNYYNRCLNADADRDGWNDSLEHTMTNLVYPIGYIDGVYQPYILWGSNYLSDQTETGNAGDEIDSSPSDLNDDGMINSLDSDKISLHLGEGNGIPLEQISPNASDAGFIWANTKAWRRYDLDGDGYVSQIDADIVFSLIGQSLPLMTDSIAPTARVISPIPGSNVTKGADYLIKGHVWDNAGIARVDYLIDGKTQCTATNPVPTFGFTSPFYACWWSVPKRAGIYQLAMKVYDAAGYVTTSKSVNVTAQ